MSVASGTNRRSMLAMMASATLAELSVTSIPSQAQVAVPWSKGTEKPAVILPPGATDCHHHIYSRLFKNDPTATVQAPDASIADYRLLQARLGLSRNVVIQPSAYGIDNSGLLLVLTEFGLKTTRGVAVVNTGVSQQELQELDRAGVRGIRFNLANPGAAATSVEMIEPLSRRIADLGWHIQLNFLADMTAANEGLWDRIPVPIVFDHLGHLPEPAGVRHPAFKVMTNLMRKGKDWVKLTGFYNDTAVGPPSYADSAKVAAAFVAAAPEQVLWGTDWPHPTEKVDNKPDDALILDIFAGYVTDEAMRKRILIDNPSRLYGFS